VSGNWNRTEIDLFLLRSHGGWYLVPTFSSK